MARIRRLKPARVDSVLIFSGREFQVYTGKILITVNIGVRAGGGEGGCSPPKFWATQIVWAARENLGKASF